MQGLFNNEAKEFQDTPSTSAAAKWSTTGLGFIGSAIICWIGLGAIAPPIASSWRIVWIERLWPRVALAGLAALPITALLSRIEGTIWGKYYVIVGYILSLALVIWIVLRLLHYV